MNILKTALALAMVGMLAAPAALAVFDDDTAKTKGFDPSVGTFEGIEPTSVGLIDSIIAIINALLVLAAIAAIAFIIIGGVRYITAQGDEDALLLAKNTVIYAIIGIVVIILAAVLVNYFVRQV